jgi:uridine phosphorylase
MVSRERILLTIGAVAAEGFEFSGLLRHCRSVEKHDGIQFLRSGLVGENRWWMAAHGPGPRLARMAREALPRVDVLVSVGLCGALDPGLELNTIYVAREVRSESGISTTRIPVSEQPYDEGALLSVDRFIRTAAEKRSLFSEGARVVEMEAAGIAASGVPFYCVRVVSDTAREDFVMDFNQFRDAAGRFDRRKIMLEALRHPFKLVPDLVRFGKRGNAAAQVLGDFLVHCHFSS